MSTSYLIQRVSHNLVLFSVEQLHDIEVYVGNKLGDQAQLCGVFGGPATTRNVVSVVCSQPLNGSTVTLVKNTNGEMDSLVLCEVDVFGEPGTY